MLLCLQILNHHSKDLLKELPDDDLQRLGAEIRALAHARAGKTKELLALLRLLDSLHVEIRETLFLEVLPTNRQALYALLRDIEASGGWPYISRLKLRDLMARMPDQDAPP